MLTVATINLGNKAHDITLWQQRTQLRRLARLRVDVIVAQECLSSVVAPVGYRITPTYGTGVQDRIMVRRGLRVLGHGYLRAHPGSEHQWPAAWIPSVTIDAPSMLGEVDIYGAHFNSRIEAGGKPAAIGTRWAYARHHIETVADLARFSRLRLDHPAVVTGDFNVDAYADQRVEDKHFPAARLEHVGLVEALPASRSGTLGSRRVDRLFHSTDLRATSVRTLAHGPHNDHDIVIVTLEDNA